MLTLSAKTREKLGKKIKTLREKGDIPAVIYGPGIKNISLEIKYEDFEKVFKQTGESSLVSLEIDDQKKKRLVLVHEIQKDPVTNNFLHIDFYEVPLKKEVEVVVPLVIEGIAPAVKELGGTLVKNFSEIKVKALPQNLPHEIKINVEGLRTFGDHILIKDLVLPEGVKISKEPNEIVVSVAAPTKVEEELAKPIEEKVEEVAKVEKEKKEEVAEEEAAAEEKSQPKETK